MRRARPHAARTSRPDPARTARSLSVSVWLQTGSTSTPSPKGSITNVQGRATSKHTTRSRSAADVYLLFPTLLVAPRAATQIKYESDDAEDRQHARRAEDGHHGRELARRRVVVVAVQNQRVHGRAYLPLRRLDEREPQVLRRILDAVEVVREFSFRRRHHDRGGVRELLRLFIPDVLKARGLREAFD